MLEWSSKLNNNSVIHHRKSYRMDPKLESKLNDLRIRIFLWSSFRTVCCKVSSLLCSTVLLWRTEVASLWISKKMLHAWWERSESCCRRFFRLVQLTSFKEVHNCELNTLQWSNSKWDCPPSDLSGPVFNLHKFWGSRVRLWKGMPIQKQYIKKSTWSRKLIPLKFCIYADQSCLELEYTVRSRHVIHRMRVPHSVESFEWNSLLNLV